MEIYCIKCNFKGEKDHIPFRCPYCHRVGTLDEMSAAQQLIDEVS